MIESGSCGDGNRDAYRASTSRMYGWLLLVVLALVVADQASKLVAIRLIEPYRAVGTPFGRILSFTLVYNEGAAYGILHGKIWFIMVVTVLFVAAVAVFWRRIWQMGILTRVAAAMMVAGSLGNFVDRARLGRVIDFIEMPIMPLFQVFNLADAFLVLGTAVLVYSMLRAS